MGMVRTALLLAGLTALFGVVGLAIGGQSGMIVALLIAGMMNLFAYWQSDNIVLKLYRAQPISPEDFPGLYQIIQRLAQNAQIPLPKAYIIQNEQPNAFATGRNPEHGAVAVTTGLLNMLTKREIAGVIAHEMAHIKNRDTLIMTITATMAGAISMLANFGLFFGGRNSRLGPIVVLIMAILAPLAAMLVQMAISRTREYAADRTGAMISGDPLGLAAALEKIAMASGRINNIAAEKNPATAHMFIMNPLHLQRIGNLFSTHPDPKNRIERLHALAKELGI